MATYNGEKHIREQIDSILPQLNNGDELIISDDGSTDNTLKIIKTYNSTKIVLLHHKADRSASTVHAIVCKNLETGLFYNVQGKTLEIVGTGVVPDVYTLPFHSLNFNFSKNFGSFLAASNSFLKIALYFGSDSIFNNTSVGQSSKTFINIFTSSSVYPNCVFNNCGFAIIFFNRASF